MDGNLQRASVVDLAIIVPDYSNTSSPSVCVTYGLLGFLDCGWTLTDEKEHDWGEEPGDEDNPIQPASDSELWEIKG